MRGEENSFVCIFQKNYDGLCLYAAKIMGNFEEAEDLVQDVFVRFWEMHKQMTAIESVRSYLYRMTKNACLDKMRKKQYQMVEVEKIADELADFFQPESEEDSKIDLLLAAIDKLPEKCRKIFISICVNGRKYKDVAEDMNISVNTIKTQVARSFKLLRGMLRREDFDFFLFLFVNSR